MVSAVESAGCDRAAIDAGVPSRALMRAAGTAATSVIARRYADRLERGVAVFAGPGNNGGDGWVVASALAAAGFRVRVTPASDARPGSDAAAERVVAHPAVRVDPPIGSEGLVIDALLGTGSSGAPKGAVAEGVERIAQLRAGGAAVVALDLPTGVDATTGDVVDARAVRADLTITFGTLKRGLLVARDWCGEIAVVDIGLGPFAASSAGRAPTLVDAPYVRAHVPAIPAGAHKGTRGYLAIVAGGEGMIGAAILAARAAYATGIGLVRCFVAPANVPVIQGSAFEATAAPWPESDAVAERDIGDWADAILLGPGLGTDPVARGVVERVLRATRQPIVVDADALNIYAGRAAELGTSLAGRPAAVTPHPAEFSRLTGRRVEDVLADRFDVGAPLASTLNAAVLLKGVPTVITAPDPDGAGERLVSAAGTPVLAVGGSGDVLGGIIATLLAQTGSPVVAAASGAWIHGRAAEIAGGRGPVRGHGLGDVVHALREVWRFEQEPPMYPVLAELRAVGDPR